MEVATKLVTIIGSMATIYGLFSVMTGTFEYFQGYKNENSAQMDKGLKALITGAVLAAIAGSVTIAIVTALKNITF